MEDNTSEMSRYNKGMAHTIPIIFKNHFILFMGLKDTAFMGEILPMKNGLIFYGFQF